MLARPARGVFHSYAVSHENLTAIPEIINGGTQVFYRRTLAEFKPSAGWTLALYLAGRSAFNKSFFPVGESFEITLTPAETTALLPGNYQWEERATKGSEKQTAASGTIAVRPDIATATAGSLETRAAKMLTAVRAAIDIRLGIGSTSTDLIESYTIGSRSLTKVPLRELLDIEARLAMTVKSEEDPGKLGPVVEVRFIPAS